MEERTTHKECNIAAMSEQECKNARMQQCNNATMQQCENVQKHKIVGS